MLAHNAELFPMRSQIEVDYYEIRFEEGLRELEKQIDIILSRTSKTEKK